MASESASLKLLRSDSPESEPRFKFEIMMGPGELRSHPARIKVRPLIRVRGAGAPYYVHKGMEMYLSIPLLQCTSSELPSESLYYGPGLT